MIKKLKENTGFTLIELIIYMAVLSVVVVIMSNTLITFSKGKNRAEAAGIINANLRFAMEKVKRDIESSTDVSTPEAADQASSTLSIVIDGQITSYSISDGQLLRKVGAEPAQSITDSAVRVQNLDFFRLENFNADLNKKKISINISMSVEHKDETLGLMQSGATTVELINDL